MSFRGHKQYIGVANRDIVNGTGKIVVRRSEFISPLQVLVVVITRVSTGAFNILDFGMRCLPRLNVKYRSLETGISRLERINQVLCRQVVTISVGIYRTLIPAYSMKAHGRIALQTFQASVSTSFESDILHIENNFGITLVNDPEHCCYIGKQVVR